MRSKTNSTESKTRSSVSIFIVVGLCCFFYILGAWQKSGFGKGDSIALEVTKLTDCGTSSSSQPSSTLNFETHHSEGATVEISESKATVFKPCSAKYIDYTPCHDQKRAMTFPRENMIYRERHCPPEDEKLHCLIPAPKGYRNPFPWPKSRDYVPYANVPYKSLTIEKAVQNWVQFEGDVFKFPGGGTMFPQGADKYIDDIAKVIPIADGTARVALDTGCGVASWGAYLFKRNVLTMSFAPRDSHEAQVQFALERGVPAVINVIGTERLPYPSRAFDMSQCSRCLIPWTANDGLYMMEVDRVLRPGGYWILSGPPINWRQYYQSWQRSKEELEKEQDKIEEIAEILCWEKKYEKGDIAIWQKRINRESCPRSRYNLEAPPACESVSPDDAWSKKMERCITPLPKVNDPNEVAGGVLEKFPARLNAVPPRVLSGSLPGVTVETFQADTSLWKKHVKAYKRINKYIGETRYRNIMDMNAGLGGFAAAVSSNKAWVMNVVPNIAKENTLGVIYERGLIGIYHDWCEAFSTYPRTYDLIHANGVFSLYQDRCNIEDILLEMDRVLRPEGAVIFRDDVDVLNRLKKMLGGIRWDSKMLDHEDGPLVPEKILVAVKQYWVTDGNRTVES